MRIDDDRYQDAWNDWRYDEWLRRCGFDPTVHEPEEWPEEEESEDENATV